MKKLLALLLAALMVVTVLVACGEDTPSESTAPSAESTASVEEKSEEASAEEKLVPHLNKEDEDLNGFTLTILVDDSVKYAEQQFAGIVDEEDNSDPIASAVADRNAKLKQEYGFDIVTIVAGDDNHYGEFANKIRRDIEDGEVKYQVMSSGAYWMAPLTAEGDCLDLYHIDEKSYLSLDADWWDPVTQEDMSIANCLYMLNGDILLTDDQFTYAVYFNKDLASEKHLDPYEEVRNNTWTYDTMYSMMKECAIADGDGEMDCDSDDIWGLVGVYFDTYQLIMGSGDPQVVKDKDDLPVFAMLDERNVNAFMKVYEIVTDSERTALKEDYASWNDYSDYGTRVHAHFYRGNALFFTNTISAVSSDEMRNADIHYGILPMPKLEEEQEYASTINPYHFGIVAINSQVASEDISKITFCLEAMAYTSKQMVTSQYYDVTLKLKRFADDDDSPDMLDIIFGNRLVDISIIFNWNDCIQYYNQLISAKNNGIEGAISGKVEAFNLAMEETIQTYKDVAGIE